ncbi:hypothetical protein VUR80DRAFT_5055 [Thermomyces stellatus]
MTVSKSSIVGTLDLGESIHSSRHHDQSPAESAAEDSHQEPPDSHGDFLPHLNIHVVSEPSQSCGILAAASASETPVDIMYSVGTPLTPATLAALGDSRASRFDSWIEAAQYNSRIAIEGARAPAGGDDVPPLTGADELIAVGDWCVEDPGEYPVAVRSEDVLAEEDDMSDWVKITKDEV